jgi:hypothetical protein
MAERFAEIFRQEQAAGSYDRKRSSAVFVGPDKTFLPIALASLCGPAQSRGIIQFGFYCKPGQNSTKNGLKPRKWQNLSAFVKNQRGRGRFSA